MSDTYRIVGTGSGAGNVEFGTTGVGYTAVGQVQSGSRKDGGKTLELVTRKGNTFCVIYFDDRGECTLDAIFDSTYTLPARGDAIDVCGLTGCLVMDVSHKWAAGKERGISLTITKFSGALTLS